MKTKEEIVKNWLPRYTGEQLENFGKYLLLTNFSHYLQMFADWNGVKVADITKPMQCATAGDITLINFGMGSPYCCNSNGSAYSDLSQSCIVPWKMRRT
jgi:AMP nucleosidase